MEKSTVPEGPVTRGTNPFMTVVNFGPCAFRNNSILMRGHCLKHYVEVYMQNALQITAEPKITT